MIIKNLLAQRANATGPIAKIMHHSQHSKAIAIALKKGITWKDHKTAVPATLIVSEGSVIYKEGDKIVELGAHDNYEIPIDNIHSLEAAEDSLVFVIQG